MIINVKTTKWFWFCLYSDIMSTKVDTTRVASSRHR